MTELMVILADDDSASVASYLSLIMLGMSLALFLRMNIDKLPFLIYSIHLAYIRNRGLSTACSLTILTAWHTV